MYFAKKAIKFGQQDVSSTVTTTTTTTTTTNTTTTSLFSHLEKGETFFLTLSGRKKSCKKLVCTKTTTAIAVVSSMQKAITWPSSYRKVCLWLDLCAFLRGHSNNTWHFSDPPRPPLCILFKKMLFKVSRLRSLRWFAWEMQLRFQTIFFYLLKH